MIECLGFIYASLDLCTANTPFHIKTSKDSKHIKRQTTDLLVVQEEMSVISNYRPGTLNICSKCHGKSSYNYINSQTQMSVFIKASEASSSEDHECHSNTSNSCWDNSVWIKVLDYKTAVSISEWAVNKSSFVIKHQSSWELGHL